MTPPEPPLWQMLSQYLRLTPRQATLWWRALGQAKWALTQEWRRKVLLFAQSGPHSLEATMQFVHQACTPVELVTCIEALMQEGFPIAIAQKRALRRPVCWTHL
jgi:hypothetical protein